MAGVAIDPPSVDADDETSRRHVLVTKCRPVIGCRPVDLAHFAWVRVAGHRLDEGGSQLWRIGAQIKAPNERPAVNVESILMPIDMDPTHPESAVWPSPSSRHSRGPRQPLAAPRRPRTAGHRVSRSWG